MINTLQAVVAAITAGIGLLTAIYKLGFKNDHIRTRKYYKHLLRPFAVAYKENNTINSCKFVKKNAKRDNDNIPKYIFYLVDKGSSDDLKKVLLYDYFDHYRNDNNTMKRVALNINKCIVYFVFFLAFICLFYAALCFGESIFFLLGGNRNRQMEFDGVILKGWDVFVRQIVSSIMFDGLYFACLHIVKWINIDMYSVKEKEIKKIVGKKINAYNKNIQKIVL